MQASASSPVAVPRLRISFWDVFLIFVLIYAGASLISQDDVVFGGCVLVAVAVNWGWPVVAVQRAKHDRFTPMYADLTAGRLYAVLLQAPETLRLPDPQIAVLMWMLTQRRFNRRCSARDAARIGGGGSEGWQTVHALVMSGLVCSGPVDRISLDLRAVAAVLRDIRCQAERARR